MGGEGKFLSQVWTVAAKELRVLFRIPSVIIFTICVPLLIYTPCLVGVFVFDLWQEANTDYRIALSPGSTSDWKAFNRIVDESKRFKVEAPRDGLSALKQSKVDLLA